MKKIVFVSCTALLFLALACKKDGAIDPNRGRSYLHIISTVQNPPNYNLIFQYYKVTNTVIGSFHYNRNWPLEGYADLEEGGAGDEFGNGKLFCLGIIPTTTVDVPDDTVMKEKAIVLTKDEKSTLCFTDSAGEIALVKFKDVYTNPVAGQTSVRFINLHQGYAGTSLLSSNNTNINLSGNAFLGASAFVTVPSGIYNFIVRGDAGGTTIGGASNLDFESESVYTIHFSNDNGTPVLNRFRH